MGSHPDSADWMSHEYYTGYLNSQIELHMTHCSCPKRGYALELGSSRFEQDFGAEGRLHKLPLMFHSVLVLL